MVEVYYYFAEKIKTLSRPSATFGPSDQPSYPVEKVKTLSNPDGTFGDPRPVCVAITKAKTLSTPTAVLGGVVGTCLPLAKAKTLSAPSVVFGAVAATCQAMAKAKALSRPDAILGAVTGTCQPMSKTRTLSTPTASVGTQIGTCHEITKEKAISRPTAVTTYQVGQQRHPKHRRPRPFSRRAEQSKGAVRIYSGMCLGGRGNDVWPLRASDQFAGFAVESASITDPRVWVQRSGTVHLPVSGVSSAASIGSRVYAIHDDSFTLTSAAGYVLIGRVQSHVTGSICVVSFDVEGIAWP